MEKKKILVPVPPSMRFEMWYRNILRDLEKIKNGNGAIASLMVAFPLYERYVRYEIEVKGVKSLEDVLKSDLGFSSRKKAHKFWCVFRHGLCHSASFFVKTRDNISLPLVRLDGDGPNLPKYIAANSGERSVIHVNPWGFVHHVLSKYEHNHSLFENDAAPLLPLFYIAEQKDVQE